MAWKAAAAAAVLGLCATVLIAGVTSPGMAPAGEMLQAATFAQAGKASALALQDYNEYSDESAGIVAAALKAENPTSLKLSPLQSLVGFAPLKQEDDVPEKSKKKQRAYTVCVFAVRLGAGVAVISCQRKEMCVFVLKRRLIALMM